MLTVIRTLKKAFISQGFISFKDNLFIPLFILYQSKLSVKDKVVQKTQKSGE